MQGSDDEVQVVLQLVMIMAMSHPT